MGRVRNVVEDFDLEELARAMLDLDDDDDFDAIDQALFDEYNIDFDNFSKLINTLYPMMDVGESLLTKRRYVGFSKEGVMTVKKEIPNVNSTDK